MTTSSATRCWNCGYDLRGIEVERCPECASDRECPGPRRRDFVVLATLVRLTQVPAVFSFLLHIGVIMSADPRVTRWEVKHSLIAFGVFGLLVLAPLALVSRIYREPWDSKTADERSECVSAAVAVLMWLVVMIGFYWLCILPNLFL